MINQYPLWKYLLLALIVLTAATYALPNLYGEDPAVQISLVERGSVPADTRERVVTLLQQKEIPFKSVEVEGEQLLVRFNTTEEQLMGMEWIRQALGDSFITALNLAQTTPEWLRGMGGEPMYLGLDLRGGVHFLMEVDMDAAITKAEERYVSDLRVVLRKEKIRYKKIGRGEEKGVALEFDGEKSRTVAAERIKQEYPRLLISEFERKGMQVLQLDISEKEIDETRKFALQQNITTLRNRVNELGVAEPVIQQQGKSRIVVQLPR